VLAAERGILTHPPAAPRSLRRARPRDARDERLELRERERARGEAGEAESVRRATAATPFNGAALARRTRDPGATCARLLDPAGPRAPATPATNGPSFRAASGSLCASGHDSRGEAGEAAR